MPASVSGRRYGCGRDDGRDARPGSAGRPPGRVSPQARWPGAAAAQPGHEGDQVLQGPREPVQARHDQGVAGAEVVQARGELGTVGGLARQLVGEHPDAAGLGQPAPAGPGSTRTSRPGRTRSARRSGSPARARAGRHGRRRRGRPGSVSPSDRSGNGGAGVVGHADFSTRFSGSRRLPEIAIGAPAGRVSENRSILGRPDTRTASERSSRAGTLEAGKLPPSRGVRARRTTGQRPVAATVRA